MGFVKDFKEFAMRGNVLDMAVGVIIGGAFGKIISSMVDDVIMPVVSKLTGGIDFTNLYLPLSENVEMGLSLEKAREMGSVLAYGQFLQNTVDFLIVAFCIFLMIKGIAKLNRKKEEPAPEAPAAPEPSAEEKLLTEIRDLLKNK